MTLSATPGEPGEPGADSSRQRHPSSWAGRRAEEQYQLAGAMYLLGRRTADEGEAFVAAHPRLLALTRIAALAAAHPEVLEESVFLMTEEVAALLDVVADERAAAAARALFALRLDLAVAV